LSQGFTVSAGSLAAGQQGIASLLSSCDQVSSSASAALSGMVGTAGGHQGLAVALAAATEQGTKTFLDISAAYAHVGENLTATADAYANAEQDSAKKVAAVRNRVG
jgi:hypothetical protein